MGLLISVAIEYIDIQMFIYLSMLQLFQMIVILIVGVPAVHLVVQIAEPRLTNPTGLSVD